jgi:hypothetical protein
LEAFSIVDADRVKKKLPSLLVANCSRRNKKGWNDYRKVTYRISKLKRKKPSKYDSIINKVVAALNEAEKAICT